MRIKQEFQQLDQNYLFALVAEKRGTLPPDKVINLGTGDIARPLCSSIAEAIIQATQEMTTPSGMHGYGPELGYDFLRQAILDSRYQNLQIDIDEIVINDGIATEICLFQDLFAPDIRVALQDPCYPPYFETLKIRGHFQNVITVPLSPKNGFCAKPPSEKVDLIYLCSPHNPTGTAMNRKLLKQWVDYAKKNEAIILFDAAYEAFITSKDVPRSIYEIEGARDVAIEFCSFSKSAGFTGLRCGFVVCPKNTSLLPYFQHLKMLRTNGVAYPIQRGAQKALSKEGQLELKTHMDGYQRSMSILRDGMRNLGFDIWGGIDCPYLWWKIPMKMDSLSFFHHLCDNFGIVAIPGVGFGPHGEGYMRISCLVLEEVAKKTIQTLVVL